MKEFFTSNSKLCFPIQFLSEVDLHTFDCFRNYYCFSILIFHCFKVKRYTFFTSLTYSTLQHIQRIEEFHCFQIIYDDI